MTEQELLDELAGLQQNRLDLAAQLDQMTLRLNLWDEHAALLQKMLVTLQTQGEQEKKLVQVTAAEGRMVTTTPDLPTIRATRSLGA